MVLVMLTRKDEETREGFDDTSFSLGSPLLPLWNDVGPKISRYWTTRAVGLSNFWLHGRIPRLVYVLDSVVRCTFSSRNTLL